MDAIKINQPLTNLQLELLQVFSLKLSDNELLEIKEVLSKFFAKKAMDEMDEQWDENKMNKWLQTDFHKK